MLTLSPPLDLQPKWFAGHLAYSLSKYGMSLCMLGLAQEYRAAGIACNALWPRTTIATAAVEFALGGAAMMRRSRKPEIVADAAHVDPQPARRASAPDSSSSTTACSTRRACATSRPTASSRAARCSADLFIDRSASRAAGRDSSSSWDEATP